MNDQQKLSFNINREYAITTLLFVLVIMHLSAFAQDKQVKTGMLALRGAEESIQRWTTTAEYLTNKIPEYTFIIVPVSSDQTGQRFRKNSDSF